MSRKGQKMSEEHKKKIGDANRGKKKPPWSEEQRRKASERMRIKNPSFSKEVVDKIKSKRKGFAQTEEIKLKISNALKGRKLTKEQKENLRQKRQNKPVSDETRKKLSEANKKRYSDPKEREKVSLQVKKRYEDPIYREKMRLAVQKGQTPEVRKRQGESLRKTQADPEFKARQIKQRREKWQDPEYRARMFPPEKRQHRSELAKKQWANKEIRQKMVNGLNDAWQNPSNRRERLREFLRNQGNSGWNGGQYVRGHHESPKAGRVYFRSAFESTVYKLLDENDNIQTYKVESVVVPYELNGRKHDYFVDLEVFYKDGTVKVVEIKPKYIVENPDPQTQAKHLAASNLLPNFEIWTEDELCQI